MTTAIAKSTGATSLEKALINGDLATLSPEDRLLYYRQTCESLGLNPLTKPFDYIKLNGKLTLYARKDATDQLRKLHGVSIEKPEIQQIDNLIIVTVVASDQSGRTDSDIGVVGKGDMQGNVGNALMKAVTKAKRRVTLSICGLGMLDETEVETIPDAVQVVEDTAAADRRATVAELCNMLNTGGDSIKWTPKALKEYIGDLFNVKTGTTDLSVEQLGELVEDLQERLDVLNSVDAPEN